MSDYPLDVPDRGDLRWLHGYRLRAAGKPRPIQQREVVEIEGWDDLDALMQLIEKALGGPSTG